MPTGFEPAISGVTGRRKLRLSHGTMAERARFERADLSADHFQGDCHKPLGHLSSGGGGVSRTPKRLPACPVSNRVPSLWAHASVERDTRVERVWTAWEAVAWPLGQSRGAGRGSRTHLSYLGRVAPRRSARPAIHSVVTHPIRLRPPFLVLLAPYLHATWRLVDGALAPPRTFASSSGAWGTTRGRRGRSGSGPSRLSHPLAPRRGVEPRLRS